MIKFIKNILKKDFIRNSSLVFIVNNINNVFNYVLIIVAIFYLKNDFGLWTSTSGFLAILSVPTSSFMSILTRSVSNIAKRNPDQVYNYYIQVFKFVKSIQLWIFLAGSALTIIMFWSLSYDSVITPILAILSILAAFVYSINQNFLLGILEIPKYCWGNVVNLVVKFVSTIGFLSLGLGINTLPLAILLASIASFVLSYSFIAQLYKGKTVDPNIKPINILADSGDTWKAMVYFVILAIFLNIDIVLSRPLLTSEQNNQYGIISTFGQIAHFGPVSFSSLIVPYASRDGHRSVYKISILAVICLNIFVTLLFILAGPLVLNSFGKSSYYDLLPLISVYSIFVMAYNVIFISLTYLISRANFSLMKPMTFAVVAYVLALLAVGTLPIFEASMKLSIMIGASLVCTIVTSIYLASKIMRQAETPNLSKL